MVVEHNQWISTSIPDSIVSEHGYVLLLWSEQYF